MIEYRVLVAVVDPMLRALMVAQVEQLGHTVVGEVDSPPELVPLARERCPDAVVVQWLASAAQESAAVVALLGETNPAMRLVVVVDPQRANDRIAALAAGAWACVAGPSSVTEVLAAFEQEPPATAGKQSASPRQDMTRQQEAAPISVAPAPIQPAAMGFLKRAV